MIESVTIQNFESHEDTTINFSDGFCLIEGLSNSGKSSIIRSIAAVVNNRWEKSMVRNGFEFCRIKLETDKGWVECERGEKVNRWRCFDGKDTQEYHSIGTGVPELATKILGMGERIRGDIKELPNFIFQLEKHYMLSEIDGKKATSNMVARMMDNAIGLGGMEELIKDVSSDIAKDRRWLTEKQSEINELKKEVIDEAIFSSFQQLINEVNKISREKNNIVDALKEAEEKLNDIMTCIENKNKASDMLKLYDSIDDMVKLYDETIRAAKITEVMLSVQYTQSRMEELEKYISIKTVEIEKSLQDTIVLDKKIAKASEILMDARRIWQDISSNKKKIQEFQKNSVILDKEFDDMKVKLGACPLCERKF